MNYNFKKLDGSTIDLKAELSPEEFSRYFNRFYNNALASIELKGFRKGAAPRELAEKAIDKNAVWEKAANEAVRRSLSGIAKENNWIIIDQPKIEVAPHAKGLKYSGRLVLFPEVRLPDYKKIAAEEISLIRSNLKAIKISDTEVEKSLNWLRESRAVAKTVNRVAQKGDVIDINFDISADGRPLVGFNNQRDRFILGQGQFLPGFEDKLVGSRTGAELEFSLIPPNHYWKKEWRGRKLDFKIKVNNILERELPPADDGFARRLGKFKDLTDLKTSIKSGLKEERELKEKEKAKIKILERIIEKADIDTPEVMVNKLVEKMRQEPKAETGENEKKLKEIARRRIESQLVVYKIAEQEGLKPTEEELEKEKAKFDNNDKLYDYIYDLLQSKKVLAFLEKQDNYEKNP